MRRKRVTVLGCGPAGLFAAAAAEDAGHDVQILSRFRKSEMFGAQYLHAPLPGLSVGRGMQVNYRLEGTLDGYRAKVYGPESQVEVSPETLLASHLAWDIRTAYDRAWERFSTRITDAVVTRDLLINYRLRLPVPQRVISSLPLDQLCMAGHTFGATQVYAKGDAPERDQWCPVSVTPWTVVCNGEKSPAWYRASNIFGYKTAEWPGANPPPVKDLGRVIKPVMNNCDCWTKIAGAPVLRVGRYGRWTKGELAHQAYERTLEWLS